MVSSKETKIFNFEEKKLWKQTEYKRWETLLRAFIQQVIAEVSGTRYREVESGLLMYY